MLSAALTNSSSSSHSQDDLLQLMIQAKETWEYCNAKRSIASKSRQRLHWQHMEEVARELERELSAGQGPVTLGGEDFFALNGVDVAAAGGTTAQLRAAGRQLLSVLLQPNWWELNVADHTARSLISMAQAGQEPVDLAADQTAAHKADQRTRQRAFLTTCLWLETFGAVAEVSVGGEKRQ